MKRTAQVITVTVTREKTPVWRKAMRAAALLLAAVRLGLLIAGAFGVQLYAAGMGRRPLLFCLDALLLLASAGSIRLPRKLWYAPLFLLAALLLFLYGQNAFAYGQNRAYWESASPGGAHVLVVEEESSMFSGRARFYEKLGPLFVRQRGELFALDDGWQSFRESRTLIWRDEQTAEYRGTANGREFVHTIEF